MGRNYAAEFSDENKKMSRFVTGAPMLITIRSTLTGFLFGPVFDTSVPFFDEPHYRDTESAAVFDCLNGKLEDVANNGRINSGKTIHKFFKIGVISSDNIP